MKPFQLATLALGASLAAADPECSAQCGSEIGFVSSQGPELLIKYDGETLTVPQHCRESDCTANAQAVTELRAENAALQSALKLAQADASKALAIATQLKAEADLVKEAQQNAAKKAEELFESTGGLTPPKDAPSGPEGAHFMLVASVLDAKQSIWKGCDSSTMGERGAKGSDYWLGLHKWQAALKAQNGRPAHLYVQIFAPSGDYLLQYNNWQLSDDLQQYRHDGGGCYQGNCPSGPQMQHNDNRDNAWTGQWNNHCCAGYDRNGQGGFGWYGQCGYGQFGFEEGPFSHPIDRNGQYQNPPVTVTRKEYWMRLD